MLRSGRGTVPDSLQNWNRIFRPDVDGFAQPALSLRTYRKAKRCSSGYVETARRVVRAKGRIRSLNCGFDFESCLHGRTGSSESNSHHAFQTANLITSP